MAVDMKTCDTYDDNEYVKIAFKYNFTNGFEFKEGLNVDVHKMNENDVYGKGGLSFCKLKDCVHVVKRFVKEESDLNIWRVSLPPEETVLTHKITMKAQKIILNDCKRLFENDFLCKYIVQKNGELLKYVKNQTEEICELAVMNNGLALAYVNVQTEKLCEMALTQNTDALKYVKLVCQKTKRELTESEQAMYERLVKFAINFHASAIIYVQNPTEEQCAMAINKDPTSIGCIQNQTKELCEMAIRKYPKSFRYIKKQTEELCELAVSLEGRLLADVYKQTERICELAIKNDGLALVHVNINKRTERLDELAVQQNGLALNHVLNQTENIRKLAVKQNSMALRYIDSPTMYEIIEIAVKNDSQALIYIKDYKMRYKLENMLQKMGKKKPYVDYEYDYMLHIPGMLNNPNGYLW